MIGKSLATGLLIGLALAGPVSAGDYGDLKVYSTRSSFADVAANVQDGIVNRGYVIDYHGFVGKMLGRTGDAVGSSKVVYKNAEFFQFCSALLTRKMVEADPRNIAYCPYVVSVYELTSDEGTVHVSYRKSAVAGSEQSKKALGAIDALLDELSREAIE